MRTTVLEFRKLAIGVNAAGWGRDHSRDPAALSSVLGCSGHCHPHRDLQFQLLPGEPALLRTGCGPGGMEDFFLWALQSPSA